MVTSDGQYLRNLDTVDSGRLQTFPPDYPWAGKDIAQQIGNAIPPRLALHVLSWALFDRAPNEQAVDDAVASSWLKTRGGLRRKLLATDDATP